MKSEEEWDKLQNYLRAVLDLYQTSCGLLRDVIQEVDAKDSWVDLNPDTTQCIRDFLGMDGDE